jgi:hypothetical protein
MVGGRCVWIALVGLLAAACSVSSGSRPDAGGPDPGEDGGGSTPDAAVGSSGLVLELRGVPALNAELDGSFSPVLKEVRIDLENVRAVGDAAPGDERTSRDELRLEWKGEGDDDGGEEADNEPVIVTFDQAPPGLYSNVFAEVKSYRLRGEVEPAEDTERDFEISDEPSTELGISIPLGGVVLEVGETRRVVIDVSCVDAVLDVPWDQVEEEDGKLVVDSESQYIDAVHDAMQAAFSYQGDEAVTAGP